MVQGAFFFLCLNYLSFDIEAAKYEKTAGNMFLVETEDSLPSQAFTKGPRVIHTDSYSRGEDMEQRILALL